MKKIMMGLIALVMCLSSFKGMAQDVNPRLKNDIINHSMSEIIKTLSTVYAPDLSREEFSKNLGFNKELLEINEGKEFVDQLYAYYSKGATSEEIMKGDNSSLISFVETIIKGENATFPTNNATLARRPWWKKLIAGIIKVACILISANNPELKEGIDAAGDAIDGALGD
jgi:hypothetical protein